MSKITDVIIEGFFDDIDEANAIWGPCPECGNDMVEAGEYADCLRCGYTDILEEVTV